MKSVTLDLRYPGRTVEEVRAMLADPEFRQAVCTFQQVEDSAVTIEEFDDGSMTVDLDRTYGTALVPSFARTFVGETIDLVQREEWSSPTEARICFREAPSVLSIPNSRVRCATVIENVLKIWNAPTNSDTPAKTSSAILRKLRLSLMSFVWRLAASSPVSTITW